ncbi:MAG: HNH endonuclease [Clostridium sp.]|uniref:HNH endonuclease signature motif containing protein n=1 Tax=Clostridium sp. TaxID=1506 RepID=UPI001EC7274F|nr:HNH endonuclease [Clostridium sp.]MBS5884473.1 HNH endonuclease [Clostridium sp.]MDU7147790.1 HNH endonuclease [Clostridium sp.]MDU7241681.1 HNH endonuclease [Clostridium sp.]
MIKVDRNKNFDQIITAKDVLKREKEKLSGSYNQPEVIDALKLIFSNKCYICENKKVTSYNIEHLRPHRDQDMDLKFDWDNIFLVCGHCNNIKLSRYENILDCTKVDVDEVISFRKEGNFAWDEYIEIKPIVDSEEVDETVDLLKKVYNGTTAMKEMEAVNIKKELRNEIIKFMNIINEYWEAEGEDKEDAKYLIIRELKPSSPFAAFKRWIVRDNRENLNEFLEEDFMKVKLI